MSYQEDTGERLREAACVGDLDLLSKLVNKPDYDINSKNQINGWTPLHWACKRNHVDIVHYLLDKGADKSVQNVDGNLPAQLTANSEIRQLLGALRLESQRWWLVTTRGLIRAKTPKCLNSGLSVSPDSISLSIRQGLIEEHFYAQQDMDFKASQLSITPNYLANPPFPYASSNGATKKFDHVQNNQSLNTNYGKQELVLKARIANSEEKDFIEIELERSNLSFENLLNLMCAELGVDKKLLAKVRKLPNTIVRKDKDVFRLTDFQEMELCLTNKAMSASSRTYNLAPAHNHETILY